MIDGKYRQVMLSVRELNTESMPNRSWVNERLIFTHGYGLTLGPVNQVTTEGLPVLFIRDMPPVSTVDLRVEQPSIYFGELSSDYVLVKTRQPEFHYPRGDDNVTTTYDGHGRRADRHASGGGCCSRSGSRRRTSCSRTSSRPRAGSCSTGASASASSSLAPFLRVRRRSVSGRQRRPAVLDSGRVHDDGRTTRTRRRRRRRSGSINYIRNSVKIVIDAYNGTMSFYLAEPNDPLALTIGKIFPGMLQPLAEMPADLRQHVRYPEDIFKIRRRSTRRTT